MKSYISKNLDNIKSRRHYILGFPHANTLGIIRSLGAVGIRPIVLSTDCSSRNGLLNSKYVGNVMFFETILDGAKYLLNLSANEKSKDFLYLMSDEGVKVCDGLYRELSANYYFFSGGGNSLLPYFDKENLCKLALECGLPTPQFERIKKNELPKIVPYPIFIKPCNSFGAWKTDMDICRNENELLETYKRLQSDEFIVENFISKISEVSVQGLSVNGGEYVYMPLKKTYCRLREKDYGTYMYYDLNDLSADIKKGIQQMLKKIHFSGCFEVEFLVDANSRLCFLETNLRFSASNQGMLYGGVNLPVLWALSELSGEKVDEDAIPLRKRRFYVMNELYDFMFFVRQHKINLFSWIRDIIKTDCFFIFSLSDLRPLISYLSNVMKNRLKLRKQK